MSIGTGKGTGAETVAGTYILIATGTRAEAGNTFGKVNGQRWGQGQS